ncbi:hypothetical protein M8J77_021532 [Diaphorina citri]|nr:hypothetical protein M8J77_021532 [Diaphorina citri]
MWTMMKLKMRVINVEHQVPSVHLLSWNRVDDIPSDVEDVDYDGVEDEDVGIYWAKKAPSDKTMTYADVSTFKDGHSSRYAPRYTVLNPSVKTLLLPQKCRLSIEQSFRDSCNA